MEPRVSQGIKQAGQIFQRKASIRILKKLAGHDKVYSCWHQQYCPKNGDKDLLSKAAHYRFVSYEVLDITRHCVQVPAASDTQVKLEDSFGVFLTGGNLHVDDFTIPNYFPFLFTDIC